MLGDRRGRRDARGLSRRRGWSETARSCTHHLHGGGANTPPRAAAGRIARGADEAEPPGSLPNGYNVAPAILAKRAIIIVGVTLLATLVVLLILGSGMS